MDGQRLDQIAKWLSAADTRRGLLEFVAAVTVGGALDLLLGDAKSGAAGRRKRRKKPHHHRKHSGNRAGKGKQRHKKQKEKKTCRAESHAETCADRCGEVRNNCRQPVDCGSCDCDPPCPSCQTCNGNGQCVACDLCCDDECCFQDAVCHAATGACCVPESPAQACDGQCGQVVDTCGAAVNCGPCTCGGGCPECHVCDEATGACVPDPTQEGDDCGEEGQVCQANGRCACAAATCPDCTACAGSGFCEACSGCCDGGACVAECGVCRTCDEEGRCAADPAMLGKQCGGPPCTPPCEVCGPDCDPDDCQADCDADVCKVDGACAPNVPPVAFAGAYSADEGIVCLEISLIASDDDGQAITFVITSLPVNGQLFAYDPSQPDNIGDPVGMGAGAPPLLCYQPSRRFFHGADSFTYKAYDGFALSNEATVSIVINDVN